MSSKVSEEAMAVIKPIAETLGLEVVEVEYAKKNNGMNLTVFIDKPEGVKIEDCEALHRAIDTPLDELDPTSGSPYILNVSSLGLDRPLKTSRDFERNIGKEIEIKTYAPIDKKKLFVGKLIAYSDDNISIDIDGKTLDVDREKIAVIVPHIKF